jgi:hypothetical protein
MFFGVIGGVIGAIFWGMEVSGGEWAGLAAIWGFLFCGGPIGAFLGIVLGCLFSPDDPRLPELVRKMMKGATIGVVGGGVTAMILFTLAEMASTPVKYWEIGIPLVEGTFGLVAGSLPGALVGIVIVATMPKETNRH